MANGKNCTYKNVPIDKQKFVDCFKKRSLLMREASIKCGVSEWYLSNQANRGKMSESVALLLEAYYNIKPEEYAPDVKAEKVVEKSVEQKSATEIDYDKLSAAINRGVYNAITDAFDVLFDKYVKEEIDAELPHVKQVYREVFDKKREEV